MKPVKDSIAYAIYSDDKSRVLAVLRPVDDNNLPNVWGLPASMLKEGESYEDAVIRSGYEKLGVKLKVIEMIGEGSIERESFTLHMKEYTAEIIDGEPLAPQPHEGMTQYQKCAYSSPEILKEAAIKGSLCSRLFLTSIKQSWQ